MPDLPNDVAHDWFGLATWALICCAFVLIARGYFKIKRGVDATVANVQNGHTTPFRVDFDALADEVRADFDALADEVRAERRERREHISELRDEMRESLHELHAKIDKL